MAKMYCWPAWMPLAQQDSYSYEPTDRRSKTDMEVGSVLRVNFDSDETSLDCTLILDAVQTQWFEIFERTLLTQGATWFQMPIQIGGCIEWHTVRFASRPKATIFAPHYTQFQLKLDIEKRELPLCMEVETLLLCISPRHIRESSQNAGIFYMGLKRLQTPNWIVQECA